MELCKHCGGIRMELNSVILLLMYIFSFDFLDS